MKSKFKKIFAGLLAAVMIFSAAPVFAFAAQVKVNTTVSVKQEHKHKKTFSVTPATMFKDGSVTVGCSECKKTLGKKTVSKIGSIKVEKKNYDYTGKAVKPSVVVKDSKGKLLKNKTDYTLSYLNNTEPGRATVKVTFKGNYSGMQYLSFAIVPAFVADVHIGYEVATKKSSAEVKLSWKKVNNAKSYSVSLYDGKKLVKTVKTKDQSASFSGLSVGKTYRFEFSAHNFLGKELMTDSGSFKIPKNFLKNRTFIEEKGIKTRVKVKPKASL